jgi:hypothetical protein
MTKSIILDDIIPLYLLSEKNKPSCERIGKAIWISGDMVLRHMSKNVFTWYDLYKQIAWYIKNKKWWIIAVDDSVQDRLRTFESKSDLVKQHYSWNHKSIVNWVDIITLFWIDGNNKLPINFRIFDQSSWKTKHNLFWEMLEEVLWRWFKPLLVTADSFYSTNDNIAKLIEKGIGIFMWIKSNRLARNIEDFGEKADYLSIANCPIWSDGKMMHIKWLWLFKVFRFEDRNYIYHSNDDEKHTDYIETEKLTKIQAQKIQRSHWCIEEYHRVLKQLCNLEWMIFRRTNQIINHIFYSIKSYCILEITKQKYQLKSWYHTITNDTIWYCKDMIWKLSIDWLCLVY